MDFGGQGDPKLDFAFILEAFWAPVGSNCGFELAFRSDFDSNCYKVWFLRGAEVICQPPPPDRNFRFAPPVGGIREGKPHTLHPPSAEAYGVGGYATCVWRPWQMSFTLFEATVPLAAWGRETFNI